MPVAFTAGLRFGSSSCASARRASSSSASGVGVAVTGVVESQEPLKADYRPEHPLADERGYVYRPNVNTVEELANMISASRSYETNVEVINTSKQLLLRTLSLGQ